MPDQTAVRPVDALRRVRRLEAKLVEARAELGDAIVEASGMGGQSYSQIGADLGLSKQRVGDLAKAARTRVTPTP